MGTVENICVFGMFFKFRKEFPSRTTKLLMSLSVSDGVMALVGGTMFTVSCFNHNWAFGDSGKPKTRILHFCASALLTFLIFCTCIKYIERVNHELLLIPVGMNL